MLSYTVCIQSINIYSTRIPILENILKDNQVFRYTNTEYIPRIYPSFRIYYSLFQIIYPGQSRQILIIARSINII